MKKMLLLLLLLNFSCSKYSEDKNSEKDTFITDITISFGSCNNPRIPNVLFSEILKNNPETFIWGGDIIYSDTEDVHMLEKIFKAFKEDSLYTHFRNKTTVLGVWDDHDYGLNDGGEEHIIKEEAQQLLLDFLEVPKEDIRRNRKGIYYTKTIFKDTNSIKIMLLDTRYFRTHLTKDTISKKRYTPNTYGQGTMLGYTQWQWLENALQNSTSNFNVIVSSIQFLSSKHGYESWGTMPHEVDKLVEIILKTKAKNVIILSGDRHIAEISEMNIGLNRYPLIDFTSSGLTHAYTNFSGEENPFRVSKVVSENNFGLLKFDFKNNRVLFEIRGKENTVLESYLQAY